MTSTVQQQAGTTTTASNPSVPDTKVSDASASAASTTSSQTSATVASQIHQSPSKPVDPKLLQQLLVQQNKITVGPGVAVSQVSGTTAPSGFQ